MHRWNMKFIVNRLFSDIINVSAGSVATCAKYGWIFTDNFTANLSRNLPVKKCENGLRFDRIVAMSLWPHFFGPLYIQVNFVEGWRCDVSKIRYCYRDHKNHLLFVIDRLIARKPNVTCIPTPLLN